jgi:hypothetical protein
VTVRTVADIADELTRAQERAVILEERVEILEDAVRAELAHTDRLSRRLTEACDSFATVDAIVDDVATALAQYQADGGTLHVSCLADLADELRDARRIIERAHLRAVQA